MIRKNWLKVRKKRSDIEIYEKMQAAVTFVERELENSKKVVLKEKWTSWLVLFALTICLLGTHWQGSDDILLLFIVLIVSCDL